MISLIWLKMLLISIINMQINIKFLNTKVNMQIKSWTMLKRD